MKYPQTQEMNGWIESAKNKGIIDDNGLVIGRINGSDITYPASLKKIDRDTFIAVKLGPGKNMLAIFGSNSKNFKGEKILSGKTEIHFCPMDHDNAVLLRKTFGFTAPSTIPSGCISLGLGDRLGIASEGHIRLMKNLDVTPVLAQQSVRELTLTDRTYEDVIDSASWAVFKEGFEKSWSADGDHLKSADWVVKALNIGFTMITADVSDFMHNEFADMDEAGLKEHYSRLDINYVEGIEKKYLGHPVKLDTGDKVEFSKKDLMISVQVYKDAVDHALSLYKAGCEVKKEFDFELSIDETVTPTTYQAHVFVARESADLGIKIASLAPRFIGEFQKGIDYIGDAVEFEKAFKVHASIARHFGYRVSVHSGSDKFGIFPAVARHAKSYHLKTAGTNWLQALEVISGKKPSLFKTVYNRSIEVFPVASKYYHITPDMNNVPDIETVAVSDYKNLFQNNNVRQVLHIAYGELFKAEGIKEDIYETLNDNIEDYYHSLNRHIGRHLELLNIKE